MRRLLVGAIVMGVAAGASASPVSGTLVVRTRPGTTPAPAVVYAEPLEVAAPKRPGTFTLMQKGKAFQPDVLAVPVGSTIEFPNQDLVFHNVFSLSSPEPFDLGLYRKGEAKRRTFTRPGLYRVFCNIHPEMAAFVAVVPTPWVAIADARGAYAFDLPAGRYRVTAVSDRAAPASAEIVVGAAAVVAPALTLDESQFTRTAHKNKFGHDYPSPTYKKP
jgi:plastocyanin